MSLNIRNNYCVCTYVALYCGYQAIGYDAKRCCGIGVVDPGAVPGDSTKSTYNLCVFMGSKQDRHA